MGCRSTSSIMRVSMAIDLPSPLAVVCHDAGATNLILPWLKDWQGELRPVMMGPAATSWKQAFPDRPVLEDVAAALDGAGTLLSGTGWASTLEHDARVAAARQGLRSVAVLDHWVNYRPRFERDGVEQIPDELWVTDDDALRIAERTFPDLRITLRPNVYRDEQLSKIVPPPGDGNILYVLEPVRNDWGRDMPGEFQALDYAIDHLAQISESATSQLILRPHPSETADKYRRYVDFSARICFDASPDLATAIGRADIVIGVESYALTLALGANRRVFSTLPPWAPPLQLPHKDIVELRTLAS